MATADKMARDAAAKKKAAEAKKRAARPTPKATADRLKDTKASTTRAGKAKSSTAARIKQNAKTGAKHGDIRIGKNGKTYNVYDAKTGTWKRGVVAAAGSKPKPPANTKGTKTNSQNTKFTTDRMNPGILPHNKGYMAQGAEGNRQLKPNPKAKPKEKEKGKGIIRWGAGSPNNPNYKN